jgi:L-ribulose-5-phosphate 3-epimerase
LESSFERSSAGRRRMSCQLAALTNTYHGYSLEDALAGIEAAGFENVELAAVRGWTEHVLLDADEAEINRVKNLTREHGLEIVSVSGHANLATDEGIELFREAMDLCEALGVRLIITGAGGELHPGEENVEALRSAFLERIQGVADEAKMRALTVCVEIHGDVVPTGAVGARLIEEAGRDNVRLNYDTGNAAFYGGMNPAEDIAHALPYVAHVHLKDHVGEKGNWDFPAIGDGEVNFDRIFERLDEVGYEGPCSVELEFQGEPWPPLSEVDRATKRSYEFLSRYIPR